MICRSSTRVWEGNGVWREWTKLAEGQRVQWNVTWATLYGPGRIREIWIDRESRTLASKHQLEKHLVYQKQRGLAGWIDEVDNGERIVTITFFRRSQREPFRGISKKRHRRGGGGPAEPGHLRSGERPETRAHPRSESGRKAITGKQRDTDQGQTGSPPRGISPRRDCPGLSLALAGDCPSQGGTVFRKILSIRRAYPCRNFVSWYPLTCRGERHPRPDRLIACHSLKRRRDHGSVLEKDDQPLEEKTLLRSMTNPKRLTPSPSAPSGWVTIS